MGAEQGVPRCALTGWPGAHLVDNVITTFGRDFAVASMFHRATSPGEVGRQTQTWVRGESGWRIVAGHVSVIDEPPPIEAH